MDNFHVQVIELRGSGGLGVFLRVDDDQRLVRIAPVRDPNQPRFWCLAAFECSACGIPVTGNAIWAGWWGSTQDKLPGLLDKIKADASIWLNESECAGLRQHLMRSRPRPISSAAETRKEPVSEAASEDLVGSIVEKAS